ncbi:hypothetical protein GCM10007242_24270 [Pigmentiphaga litoralis]|nr:hypothetical protein GCM10007242_24270 [Pigmentiphaga litoralis]
MDDLAVARTDAGANAAFRFQDEDFPARKGQRAGDCQADNAGTDYDYVYVF